MSEVKTLDTSIEEDIAQAAKVNVNEELAGRELTPDLFALKVGRESAVIALGLETTVVNVNEGGA